MTFRQVFCWFCKKNKLMSYIRMVYYIIEPKKIVRNNGSAAYVNMGFEEYLQNLVDTYSLTDLLSFYFWGSVWGEKREKIDKITTNAEGFKTNINRWKYFAKNNLFIKEESLKEGDEVTCTYAFFENRNEPLYVKDINVEKQTVRLYQKNTNLYLATVNFRNIRKNGEPLKIEYYIKRNRKVYGIDNK